MLTVYFDGSGSYSHGQSSKYLTLAGLGAPADAWARFDASWSLILHGRNHGRAVDYLHMREAVHRQGAFSGWGWSEVEFLIQGAIGALMSLTIGGGGQTFALACSLSLEDYSATTGAFRDTPIAEPYAICSYSAFSQVLESWSKSPESILRPFEAYYDQGEPFRGYITSLWQAKSTHARFPGWHYVSNIGSKDMKNTPGLQAADVLAWSINRKLSKPNALDDATRLASQVCESVRHTRYSLAGEVVQELAVCLAPSARKSS